MPEKKYQVFISSTYTDLEDERKKALDILLMADCIPAGMESFVATDMKQFEVIKKVIDLCDYYILIIGKRYGSVNPETGLSYTEMEYEYAKSKDVPVLVFAIDDSVELPDDKQEKDPKMIECLNTFREKAMLNRLATVWKTSEEFIGKLSISIMKAKNEISRPGWQRATDYDEGSLRREIMELQKQKKDLKNELDEAKKTISSFSEQTGVAFENHEIKIDYYYYNGNYKAERIVTIGLSELFSIIATEMMDVAITETHVKEAILGIKLFPSSSRLNDRQLVKRILNQFKNLKLIDSFWSKEKSTLFWNLTSKGKKVRDDMILIRST